VEVAQAEPTPRDRLVGLLSGTMKLVAEAKSYIHIWSGRTKLRLRVPVGGITAEALEREAIRLVREDISEPAELPSYGERLAIPGSSLKGAIRSRLEFLFTPSPEGVVSSCFVVQEPLTLPPSPGQHGWRHYRIWSPATEEARPVACGSSEAACIICNIFGAPGLASKVFFGNLWLVGGQEEWVEELELDYGERVLAFKPGARFEGEFCFKGLKPEELGLLIIGMRLHESRPVLIGKNKYRLRRRADTGREIAFGRLMINAESISFAPWCMEEVRSLIRSMGVELEEDEELIVKGRSLQLMMSHLASLACEAFPGLRCDFDEISRLEEVWRDEE